MTLAHAIELHPEAGADPEEVRWVVAADNLPVPGRVVRAPGDLGDLLAAGALAEVRVLPGCVVTRAPSPVDWRRLGPAVRHALSTGLAEPGRWEVAAPDAEAGDRALTVAVRRLLAGDLGAYLRSHGGSLELVDVRDGVVAVRLRGACHGCAAAEVTLRTRFERQLRAECPAPVAVVVAS